MLRLWFIDEEWREVAQNPGDKSRDIYSCRKNFLCSELGRLDEVYTKVTRRFMRF